jgi:NAD(P)-dependent dehydrogenase (short-subunit alcohol dehydrogenase family)
MGKLEGKIALVTGGNSGIGLATAKQFVNEGAYVFINGRREVELAEAVEQIRKHVTGVQVDVSNLGDLDRLFAQIGKEKGRLDIVFANAGGGNIAPFLADVFVLYIKTKNFHWHMSGPHFRDYHLLPEEQTGQSLR